MKRKFLTALIALLIFSVLSIGASAFITGDADNDFVITASDARFALRLSVGLEECDKESDKYMACDANGDGDVTAADARLILRVSVGLEKFADNTENNQGIRITKMPYKTNGLVINNITLKDNYFHLSISNKTSKTDMAVKGSSSIPYKMYNAKGDVIYSSSIYVSQMNHNESCNVKFPNKAGTAKLVFGAADVDFTEAVVVKETEVINGITVSKAPFTVNGLKVNKITIDTDKHLMHLNITNNAGKPVSGSIKFATYDANGNSLGIISVSVPSLNPGEKVSSAYTYYSSGTAKIIYNDATVYDSAAFNKLTSQYETHEGITMSKMPLTSQGITFSYYGIEYTYGGDPTVLLKITNNTGKTLDSLYSSFYIKGYDADGYVDILSSKIIPQLDNKESCIAEINLYSTTKKFDIGNLEYRTTEPKNPGAATVIDNVTTNATKSSFGGLEISEFSVNKKSSYTEITLKITNKTGKAISGTSCLDYKILSTDNLVLKTNTLYVSYALNKNEYVYKTINIDSTDVGKIYFFLQSIKEGTHISDSSSYSSFGTLKVTSAPYSSNGLKILSYRIEDGFLYVRIQNNTGSAVTASSHINYRIHGTNGAVIKESAVYCTQMNAGETCEVKMLIYDDYAKITFTNAKIYN